MRHVVIALVLASAVAVAQARLLVVTQQAVSYELPDGWTVKTWTAKTGEAISTNAATGYLMSVERHGTTGTPANYPNSESIGTDRMLKWDYTDKSSFVKGDFVLVGEVTFSNTKVGAKIEVYISSSKFTGVAKEASLGVLRAVAASLKILGARKCWPPGECPPGEAKPLQ